MAVDRTNIEWTDATWSPVRGCSRVSPGCDHCYAMGQAHRFDTPEQFEDQDPVNGIRELSKRAGPYHGLTTIRRGKVDWSGVVRFVPEMLDRPLRWRKPRRIFVNSMSDLFHESLTNEQIAAVFGVMAACPQHTFQILTKRAKRMREWFDWVTRDATDEGSGRFCRQAEACRSAALAARQWREPDGSMRSKEGRALLGYDERWPLPNVWLGVSSEDQQRADERIPDLLACPAAIRFVSIEPMFGPIDLTHVKITDAPSPPFTGNALHEFRGFARRLDWVICGSESGPGARPMKIEWAESLRDQCVDAGVAYFQKQIANANDRKGGNPKHWPGGPWPREFPEVRP